MLHVSSVRYLNSYPFNYGLKKFAAKGLLKLSLDVPSELIKDLILSKTDLALIPVAGLTKLESFQIVSDYCIGTEGKVRTVALYSEEPIERIRHIWCDTDSMTSFNLLKILCRNYWDVRPDFEPLKIETLQKAYLPDAILAIGDKCFDLEGQYKYSYDLGEEWIRFTGLPFVFACWVSRGKPESSDLNLFTQAIGLGFNDIDEVVDNANLEYQGIKDIKGYLNENISYSFDSRKEEGLNLYLTYLLKDKLIK